MLLKLRSLLQPGAHDETLLMDVTSGLVTSFGVSTRLLSVSLIVTGMGDSLWWAYHPGTFTSAPAELSLLSSVGQEMITGQRAVMLCDWRVSVIGE